MKRLLAFTLLIFLLAGCGEGGEYVFSVEGKASIATVTPDSVTTKSPTPTPLPTATQTPAPTVTQVPTQTPQPTQTPAPTATPAETSIYIYDDSLAQGWANWSWSTLASFSNPGLVYDGQYSLALTYNSAWGGFFPAGQWVDPVGSLRFAGHGGSGPKTLFVYATDGNYAQIASPVQVTLPGGQWQEFVIPLSDLSPDGVRIRGFVFMSDKATSLTMDAIRVVQPTPAPEPTPTPFPSTGTEGLRANIAWLHYAEGFGGVDGKRVTDVVERGTITLNGQQVDVPARFAEAAAAGVERVKWLAFMGNLDGWPDGPPGLQDTDGNGCPDTIPARTIEDLDAAVSLVGSYGMELELGLFLNPDIYPATWFTDSCAPEMVEMFAPVFARYDGDDVLVGYNVILEPEWSNRMDDVRNYVTLMAEAIAPLSQYSAVESAHLSELGGWAGIPVDRLQFSWYDPMAWSDYATETSEAELQERFGLTQPIEVGEFYAGGPDSASRWSYLLNNYSAAWAWSMFPEGTGASDQMVIVWP